MRHLSADDVARLLPWPAAVEAARATARTVASGALDTPERVWHRPDGMPGAIGVMPAFLPDDGDDPALFTTKVVGVFPHAEPSVDGVVAALDGASGAPLATVDTAALTARRTAAGSALSAELLARPDAATLAVIGAGVQGRAHLEAVAAVRPITAVRIWNRSAGRADALAAHAREALGMAAVSTHPSPGEAARGADVICCCTDSPTPVLGRDDVAPGAHVTAIGAYTADTRELAADLLARADVLVVDDVAAAAHEAGDVLLAVAEGAIDPRAVAGDLPALVTGGVPDRRPGDVTVYKSVGTSAMDAVAVRHLLGADAASWLAAYGTLAPGAANDHVLAGAGGSWTRGTVRGTRLADGWQGYPGLHLDPAGDVVPVALLHDDALDWAALDAFEGPGYRRRRAVARLVDGRAQVVSTYVLT